MIYKRDESEVAVLGEVEKHSVSIDAKNINHIVTILSSNLYSYPMISFLRETVSNAVDSHVEAGVNEPIIITRTKDDIAIRDFGTGISPERFRDIYLNIGSSTKRESNDYIGNFGIGRFSALSVSKLANITSFYNGKAYYYVMNMDIDQLHIDKIYELDTTEPNGVEVKIPLEKFNAKDLDCLSFIGNVYVECDGDYDNSYTISEFNKRKVHSFDYFKTISYELRSRNDKTEILLGKIPYAVDYLGLWDYSDDWHRSWKDTMVDIYPCINIGDVDITPNRESLIYSDRTKAKLREVYDNCILEITKYWNEKCAEEYEDFFLWAHEITKWRRNELELGGITLSISSRLPFNAKLKSHPEWDKVEPGEKKRIVSTLMYMSCECLGQLEDGTLYQGRKDTYVWMSRFLEDWVYDIAKAGRMVLVVPSKSGFSGKYFKDFLGHKFPDKRILFVRKQKVSIHELRSFIRKLWGVTAFSDPNLGFMVGVLRECYKAVASRVTYMDIMSSPEYIKYKKEHQDPKANVAKHTGKITFTITNTEGVAQKITMTLAEIIPYIRKSWDKHKRIVYSSLDNPFLEAFNTMRYPNLIILSAAKNNMKYLEEGLPEWVKPIEDLYTADNKVLIRYKTAQWMWEQEDVSFEYYSVMPPTLKPRMFWLNKYRNKYALGNCQDSILDVIPEGTYDLYALGEFNELLPYLKLSHKLFNISSFGGWQELKYYVLMKAKKLRPSFEYYKSMKERVNLLINSL